VAINIDLFPVIAVIFLLLFLTLLFANFAEGIAEARGKAQAAEGVQGLLQAPLARLADDEACRVVARRGGTPGIHQLVVGVLAQAQVSVAMGGGAQLARTQSDFVLLSENLDHLRFGLQRAQRTLGIIRQNLWWSFAYNFVALPLAIAGYVTPWLAGIGMSASSLLVVLNSLRIQRQETD